MLFVSAVIGRIDCFGFGFATPSCKMDCLFSFFFQLFVSAMGPPGGGRNDISGRFTRHMNIISIDSFDDNTMTKIFTSIVDWHFAKGFDASFSRLGKVGFVIIILHSQGYPKTTGPQESTSMINMRQ